MGNLWMPGQPLQAVVDPGGGGGRAGSDVTDNYALDKPYDLAGSEFNADTLQKLDEMFSILFKGLSLARNTDIAYLKSAVGGQMFFNYTSLSSAQIDTLNVTAVTLVRAAGPGTIILPINMVSIGRIPTGSNWTSWTSTNIRWNNASGSIAGTIAQGFNRSGPATIYNGYLQTNFSVLNSTLDIRNKDLVIQAGADPVPGGNGVGTVDVYTWYVIMGNLSPSTNVPVIVT
jgi:hypothetical protein